MRITIHRVASLKANQLLRYKGREGRIVDLTINKTYPVKIATDGDPYIRDDAGDVRWVSSMINNGNILEIKMSMVNK